MNVDDRLGPLRRGRRGESVTFAESDLRACAARAPGIQRVAAHHRLMGRPGAPARRRARRRPVNSSSPPSIRTSCASSALFPPGLADFQGPGRSTERSPAETGATPRRTRHQRRAAVTFTACGVADDLGARGGSAGRRARRRSALRGRGAGYAPACGSSCGRWRNRAARAPRFRTVWSTCLRAEPRVAEGAPKSASPGAPWQRGFGYDSVFEVAGKGRTLAELPSRRRTRRRTARRRRNLVSKLRSGDAEGGGAGSKEPRYGPSGPTRPGRVGATIPDMREAAIARAPRGPRGGAHSTGFSLGESRRCPEPGEELLCLANGVPGSWCASFHSFITCVLGPHLMRLRAPSRQLLAVASV